MTPKIERFLAETAIETPCLVVDLDVIRENYVRLQSRLPLARIYYAVKANPARPVLESLIDMGSYFDAASAQEVDLCLEAGATADRISYGNTVKKARDIGYAFRKGVRLFAFDSEGEVEKIAAEAPGSRVYCRIIVPNEGADWPLSRKFGCDLDMARDLMILARERGLDPYGISFHVGSQQTDPRKWEIAISRVAMVFTELREAGIELRMINLGGGYPARYRDDIPEFDVYADAIMTAMTRHFGNALPDMLIEPGRSVVGEAGVIEAEVVLISRKSYDSERRWVYLDVGKFGGLAETMDEAIRYPIVSRRGGPEGSVVIAGPTCDGVDILYENTEYTLPLALRVGDRVRLLGTGAYTTTYASIGFNGFPPLQEHYM